MNSSWIEEAHAYNMELDAEEVSRKQDRISRDLKLLRLKI